MQFNLNIDRYSPALPPIEPSPSSAAVDRSRERESFDRHLEEARRRPADSDRRSTTDDSPRPSGNEASTKPKGLPQKSNVDEKSAEKRPETQAQDGSDGSEVKKSDNNNSDTSATESAGAEAKPAKKDQEKQKPSKTDEAPAEQPAIAVSAAQLAEIVSADDTKANQQSDEDETSREVEPSVGKVQGASNAKQSRIAKAVVGSAAVDVETAPADTQPAGEPKPTIEGAVADGLDVAPVASEDTAEIKSDDADNASDADSLPTKDITATGAVPMAGARNSTTGKKGDKSAAADKVDAKVASVAEPSETTSTPRRNRTTNSSDAVSPSANDAVQPNADSPASAVDQAPAEQVAATLNQPTIDAAAQIADRTAEQLGDQVGVPSGRRDASPTPGASSATDSRSTDGPLNTPEKQASTLSSRVASGNTEKGSAATDVERVRFVQRVAKAFQSAADRGGPVRLRLSPPELGALRLEITVRNGTMTARLEAETPAARSLLLDGLPALRERLAQQDIKIERFDVDLMGQSPNDSPQTRDGAKDSQDRGAALPRKRNATVAVAGPTVTPLANSGHGDGRLNVLI